MMDYDAATLLNECWKEEKFLLMQRALAISSDGREENAEEKDVSNNGFW